MVISWGHPVGVYTGAQGSASVGEWVGSHRAGACAGWGGCDQALVDLASGVGVQGHLVSRPCHIQITRVLNVD